MLVAGVNPHIVDFEGRSRYELDGLNTKQLSRVLPKQKSVYFSVRPFSCLCQDATKQKCQINLSQPWFYTDGCLDGQFEKKIGTGASSIVIKGKYHGQAAAFKFVKIGKQERNTTLEEIMKELNKQLNELNSITNTEGHKILKLLGHYR